MPKVDLTNRSRESGGRQIVTLVVTEDCNLRCRYCYEPNKSRNHYMSLDVAQEAITYYMQEENEFDAVEFDFFGGEPMLAFGLIREVVDWFHSQEWLKRHLFFIDTNGTILTDEIRSWLVENKGCVYVGVSLDGNKTAHDINRSNSYDRVRANLPFFMEHWPEQTAKMTISAETIPYVADSIIELEEIGIAFNANLVFENIWGTPEQKSVLLSTYEQQLDRLVDYYAARPDLFPPLMLDRHLEAIYQPSARPVGGDCVRWCGAGHEMVVVGVDGSRAPCHRFMPWVTGRPVPQELVNRQASWKPDKCGECRLNILCPTCAGFNWQVNGDSGVRTTYHCEAFKLEVQSAARLQAQRFLQKQPQDLAKLPPEEAYRAKLQLDAILDLAVNGV
jgi:uncharacterized protein